MSPLLYGIIAVVAFLAGAVLSLVLFGKRLMQSLEKEKKTSQKNLQLYHLMTQWVKLKQSGVSLADILAKRGYHHIAVYGMSYVGERLIEELKGSEVTVEYAIDQNARTLYSYVDAYTPEDPLKPVDAVIVTPIAYFDAIEAVLTKKMDCPILAIDDLMYL